MSSRCLTCNAPDTWDGMHDQAVHALSDRLAALEARSPVVAKPAERPYRPCRPDCGIRRCANGNHGGDGSIEDACFGRRTDGEPCWCSPNCWAAGEPKNPTPATSEPTPQPGNSGIPDGWKLGDGWGVCLPRPGQVHCTYMDCRESAFLRKRTRASCAAHVVEMRAIVPAEPPAKAELCTGDGACGATECTATNGHGCRYPVAKAGAVAPACEHRFCDVDRCASKPAETAQAAEPSAPAGLRCPRCPHRYHIGECPSECPCLHDRDCAADCRCVDLSPAAPPVTAKPSERDTEPAGPDSFGGSDEGSHLDNSAHLALKGMLEASEDAGMTVSMLAGTLGDKLRAAETALDAANKERDDANRHAQAAWDTEAEVRRQLATRDARIAGLEASAAEDSKARAALEYEVQFDFERRTRELAERAALEARCAAAEHDAGVLRGRVEQLRGARGLGDE